jgi:transposase, IS5 family
MFKEIRSKQLSIFEPRLEDLVKPGHPYRKLLEIIDFSKFCRPLRKLFREDFGRPGYHIESGFAALVLQWMEDLSDRELERFLQENISGKYFCGFNLSEKTPNHSYFCELRKKIGTNELVKLFNTLGDLLRCKGLIANVFTFVDASQMVSKVSLWDERDKAIKAGEETLNNQNMKRFVVDKDASYGNKGKEKYWYGYKRHVAVCMKNGLISKAAATTAKVGDDKGLRHICPSGGMVIGDKSYCLKEAQAVMKRKGCHSGAILKNNMKDKNRDKDKFLSRLRMPFEGTFSKMNKRVRYRGTTKVQFQVTMQALVHNFKRLITIAAPPLFV